MGHRKFYAYKNNKLVGYVFFDPYFENGQIKGYLANILRKDPSVKPASLLDRIIVDAAFKFKEEGISELSWALALYQISANMKMTIPSQEECSNSYMKKLILHIISKV